MMLRSVHTRSIPTGETKRKSGTLLALVAAAALTLALAGCGSSSSQSKSAGSGSSSAATSSKPVKIAYFATELNNPYVQADIQGAKDAAAAEHASVSVLTANFNPQTQLSQCEDAVSSGQYQALEISAVVGTVLKGCVTQAAAKHIPVVGIDSPLGPNYSSLKPQMSGETGVVFLPTAVQAALETKYIKEACASHPTCQVARIIGQNGFAVDAAMAQGIQSGLKSDPHIKIVAEAPGQYLESGGQAAAQNMLAAHPDINVIAAVSDQEALGAQKVVTSAGKLHKILLIGDGGSTDAVKAICAGTWIATVDDHPYDIGKDGAQIAIAQARGQHPASEINPATDPPAIDKSNCAKVKGQFTIG